ncbi:zinc-binding alcohol dehydrogenase [Candidatus Bathyarchaeota archaeon]|nr:zinc-binding alcohol dehydrogenase [Candidatus Bathyarchaeota archaeon]
MLARKIFFTKPKTAEIVRYKLDETLGEHEVLVQTLYSIVSSGTEGANFANPDVEKIDVDSWMRNPGYGSVGKVLAVGEKVKDYKVGDLVFSTKNHCSHFKIDERYDPSRYSLFMIKLPDQIEPIKAVFARMADVAMSAIRMADLGLGDTVVVIGLGLVGNFAAQLFQLAGADVMAADLVEFRLERAKQCGIKRVVNSQNWDEFKKAVMNWTEGKGAQIVVEAIGFSPVIAKAVGLARSHGEVILLGSPRGEAVMDITPMLSDVHLRHVTIKGGLEWLWSVPDGPYYHPSRFSKMANLKQIFSYLKSGALVTEPLLTHIVPPEKCQEVYEGLAGGIKGTLRTTYLGVVYDWT